VGVKPFDKDMEENSKRLKLSYVPEHDGARAEWMEEIEKKSEPQNAMHGVLNDMDLRDYFANGAMKEIIARWDKNEILNSAIVAENAYELSDAMIKRRAR
jgi:hypothetical protein